VTLVACAPAHAATPRRAHARARHHAAAPAAVRPAAQPAASAGMVVGIDPETGRLGLPSSDQMLQLSPAEKTGLLRTSAGLTPVRLPDGTVKVDLQGRFLDFSVVRLDANGRLQVGCVEDASGLARWMGTSPSAPAPALEVK
jgi:hypothetical protein